MMTAIVKPLAERDPYVRHYRHRRNLARSGRLVESLKRLEYRGYDSAGVATLANGALWSGGARRAS